MQKVLSKNLWQYYYFLFLRWNNNPKRKTVSEIWRLNNSVKNINNFLENLPKTSFSHRSENIEIGWQFMACLYRQFKLKFQAWRS
jgi:hypothetical protein